MLHKVVPTFASLDEILKFNHSHLQVSKQFAPVVQLIGNLSKHDGDGWRERHKRKGLISKTRTLHARYRFWYISFTSSAIQQREMTKFKVLCRTWTRDSEFSFFYWTVTSSFQSQLPDCSATLDRLNELKLSRRSLKYLEVIFKATFSLALQLRLLRLPDYVVQGGSTFWVYGWSYSVTTENTATEKYFSVVQFIILYKLRPTFKSVDEILKRFHSNQAYWAVLSWGAVYYVFQDGSDCAWNLRITEENLWCCFRAVPGGSLLNSTSLFLFSCSCLCIVCIAAMYCLHSSSILFSRRIENITSILGSGIPGSHKKCCKKKSNTEEKKC